MLRYGNLIRIAACTDCLMDSDICERTICRDEPVDKLLEQRAIDPTVVMPEEFISPGDRIFLLAKYPFAILRLQRIVGYP